MDAITNQPIEQKLNRAPITLDNRNIKSLDGLRGYSILLVIISHIGFGHLVPGGFGVTIFFFVSGFLICKLLMFELNHEGKINFKSFYLRRIFRLYPALLFFVACVVGMFVFFGKKLSINELTASLFYYMNYNLVYIRTPDIDPLHGVFNILWSLSIEEHFYLFFPLILATTFTRKSTFITFSVLVLIICLVFRVYYGNTLPDFDDYENYNYHLTHTRMDSIMYGSLVAFLLYSGSKFSTTVYNIFINKGTIIISLGLIAFTLFYRDPFFRETYRYTLQGIALCSIVVNVIYDQFKGLGFLFSGKFIVFIGRLSYSLYLFHWVAVCFATYYFPRFTPNWYLIVVPMTIGLSLFSYFLVELPFVGLRKKFGSNV